MSTTVTELDDIQGLMRSGYGSLSEAAYLLLRVRERAAAKAWLAAARPTSIDDLRTRVSRVMQLAVTAAGLRAFGVSEAALGGFSAEFIAGMSDGTRPRRLGDVGASDPARWAWGAGATEPHALIMLFATAGGMGVWRDEIVTPSLRAAFDVVELPPAAPTGREPFGFADGLSQPTVDFEGVRTPATAEDLDYGNLMAPGEFLLGYRNEYGNLTERPLVRAADDPAGVLPPAVDADGLHDLGRNGSYLVFRQLDQDVRGFWRFLASIEPRQTVALAEAMVGRKLGGEPLVAASGRPIRGVELTGDEPRRNDFTFDSDPDGLACPFGAHVRRANPRTGDMPGGNRGAVARLLGALGLSDTPESQDLIASSRFHRLLRRGRPYGRFLTPGDAMNPATPDPNAGLYFIALNTNLVRQFEFVQAAWIMSSKFAGMTGEQDPLLGSRQPLLSGDGTASFRVPAAGGAARCIADLPAFVTLRGGAYFFLPGLRALRYIAR